ncbi:MAG: chlorophyll synthase ChlG [Aestuariivita sp.]|nr:chlorophyll synthase ChlG [Aestuariivita sp.]MCY4345701.1 chlorophyll synthase ChlG [Aestuariivita sp.]
MNTSKPAQYAPFPELGALLQLIKPITWFPPMWAYLCGVVASGASPFSNWPLILLGIVLAGPIVCGMSQAANDWCDRHVDKINEPNRPIPSGRVPGRWGLWIALMMSLLSLLVGWQLGPWGFGATVFAVLAAWAYSAEPIRLKRSGWWGPGLVGFSYESLPWFTGAAVMSDDAPSAPIILVAILYGLGAHGIMTLNDFKALEGDRVMQVRSLPVALGPELAARIACVIMLLPQIIILGLLVHWQTNLFAIGLLVVIILQIFAMVVLLKDPAGKAPWYNGTGVLLYVLGMMLVAISLQDIPVFWP